MFKIAAAIIVVLALVIGLLPQFTDCQSQGRALTLQNGKTVPMKCHWTAIAEIGMAVPLLGVGAVTAVSKRKESRRIIAGFGALLGLFVILLPTWLIGVCASADMLVQLGDEAHVNLEWHSDHCDQRRDADHVGKASGATRMKLGQFAWSNIKGSAFRSWVVFLCAMIVAGFSLSTVLIIRGAQDSLRLALNRLGADIIVVPEGTETKVESALLMGKPVKVWMPQENLEKIARVPGVAAASPQLYLSSLSNAACCAVSDMFMVAFDPKTDFTIEPWLSKSWARVAPGEAVGGSYVFTPEGEENIKLFGYFITLKGNLAPTGTGLDQTMFLTFETAQDVARISKTRAERPLEIPADSISAALVRCSRG